ncbi:GTPase family protein [uncultured Friedmanniella sp.]|uniref:GTPase family protein n=1 Tax=uncultured Friedmanniella sp. TaxID=335381 RepID=UPI0035C9B23A
MAGGTDWFRDSFREQWDGQNAAIGRFNLAIFGKTGVGKSTLINAIFGEEVAKTGIGAPVTRGSRLYVDKVGHLGIVDTQGLEVGRDNKEILAELSKAMKEMRKLPLSDQLHVAWYCVRGLDRRFEEAEGDFIRRLDEIGLPVVLVITQVPVRDGQYHPDALELAKVIAAQRLPLAGGRPFMVNAVADPFTGAPVHGLKDVLDATFQVAPEGVDEALTAAQQIDTDRKARQAQGYIATGAAMAAGAAFSPIPLSDAAMLVPIQLGMMAKIGQLYDIRFDRAALMAVASTTAATSAGRATFGGLLKLVPGVGTVAGGAISAGVASSFTYAMGQAWLAVCQRVVRGKLGGVGQALDSDVVKAAFLEELSKVKIRRDDKQSA